MTDIEQKALALVNEVRRERGFEPDPLVEALEEASGTNDPVEWANRFYAAIEKRGGKITWGEG